ncbi:hypothetical protein LDENG_00176940 [Lucifuga dentata]|nr:hypothetical protein LDENG_00176940 [Lucifuga dentata]
MDNQDLDKFKCCLKDKFQDASNKMNHNLMANTQSIVTQMLQTDKQQAINVTKDILKNMKKMNLLEEFEKFCSRIKEPPTFTEKITDAKPDLGKVAEFQCTVKGSPTLSVQWLKDDAILKDPNLETTFENNVATLRIPFCKVSHNGKYSCQAKNEAGQEACSANLTVQETPQITQNPELETVRVVESVCPVSSSPTTKPPAFTKKIPDAKPDLGKMAEFQIPCCKLNHNGKYSCLVRNETGQEECSTNLIVQEPPQITQKPEVEIVRVAESVYPLNSSSNTKPPQITEKPELIKVKVGDSVSLDCKVTGSPDLKVKWMKDDKQLHSNKRHKLSFEENISSVKIESAQPEDDGEYVFMVENHISSCSCRVKVIILEPPAFTEKITDAKPDLGKVAEFQCTVKGSPTLSVQWLKDDVILEDPNLETTFENHVATLRIPACEVSHNGKYSCRVTNEAGQEECSANLTVQGTLDEDTFSSSKSQLMNYLINDRHNTFFHRNCAGSTKSRCLMDGVAEIAWYCPAGKPNDMFNDCVAFCNLHGDALVVEKQRDIMIEKASVNVVLLPTLEKDDLSSILSKYDAKWSQVLALKKKHDKSNELKTKQTELKEISAKLQAANFGLEHIFREMGQIYEAHASLLRKQKARGTGHEQKTRHMNWSDYPALAAELMISGHPMELMDGDAGHVPLTWINSLLDQVIKKLEDKQVFVLSVLGIQSSGKSTMLNAMFGLQFAVSAGRCTKGAFMQLVKVSEELKKDFKFDYVLVVDTEGLRALELAGSTTLHHDNELATFVIGLGNMTLINILGENPADMQDVLQIVVQAFMRMKQVKLSPSCVFVHQNVTGIAAAEKNMDGKRRLQEKLDQMAKLAAKEEECYSESIQELKSTILSKASQSKGTTLLQFKSNIGDLWNALLNEHFVFSFKNTLEIAVYRKLEVQYGNWTWTLRTDLLTIENQLYNRIANGNLDKIEPSYLYEQMKKTYEEIRKAMTTYFDDDKNKEILVQWRGRFESKIKDFHDEQMREVKRKLDGVIQQKKACKKLDDKKTEFETKLLQKSKELALNLKDKAKDENELEKEFNNIWKLICEKLKDSTRQAVYDKTAIDLAGEMKCRFSPFNGNRLNLEKHVLTSLAEKKDFESYMNYIRHPRKHVEAFIKEEVEKYIFTEHKDSALSLLKKSVEDTEMLLSQALHEATEKVTDEGGGIDMWLKEFSSLLKDELKFPTICSQNFNDINSFPFLKEEVKKGLESNIREISGLPFNNMEKFRIRPDEILIEQLCKCCWVKCPFCYAVCTNTLEDHSPDDHSVPFHRSGSIAGWQYRNSEEMGVEFCTTKVASDRSFYLKKSERLVPFKQYRTAGPDYANWRITPDESKLIYWKWFVCRFQTDLENHYTLKFEGRGEIPSEWRNHTKEEAIKSLDEMYKL